MITDDGKDYDDDEIMTMSKVLIDVISSAICLVIVW
jgi:hypothetical protein